MTAPGYSGPALFSVGIYCADCGNLLELCRGGQIKTKIDTPKNVEPIAIRPCLSCIEKHTAPARALKAAIEGLLP